MLAGKGFKNVYNLSGGIKAWQGGAAFGPDDLGIALFSGKESPEETLVVAYSLEEGLRDFYLSMSSKVQNERVRALFEKLSAVELKHQERIFSQYLEITGKTVSRDEFAKSVVAPAVEGGLTTEEYLARYHPDLEIVTEVISLAMAIEAQALDLYQRVSERVENDKSKAVLLGIANEERTHLQELGKLMEAEEDP